MGIMAAVVPLVLILTALASYHTSCEDDLRGLPSIHDAAPGAGFVCFGCALLGKVFTFFINTLTPSRVTILLQVVTME